MRNRLYEVKAKKAFDEAEFYVKVPRKPRSAIIYFQKMIEEFPKSKLVPAAENRIAELEARMIIPTVKPVPAEAADAPRLTSEKEEANAVN